jgi:hypothetical protein
MHQCHCVGLRTSSQYRLKQFATDLKQAMQLAGVDREHVVLARFFCF